MKRYNKDAQEEHVGSRLLARLSFQVVFATMIFVIAPLALASNSLPTGGQVVAGQVNIGTHGNTMTINQGSNRAIVNWKGFSVGQNNTVNINQPNSHSAILNRVTGSMTSQIAGQIHANGQVFLINPNGIAITKTGSIKVGGGFVASTLGMKDKDFMNGRLKFNGNGHSKGITNNGKITVERGGYAALIGGTVANNGNIIVPMGKIGVGSGEQATLDISGDGFLQVAIPTQDKKTLISNTGTLSANGGYIQVTAATAKQAARQVVNLNGVMQANSISSKNGVISLSAGQNGDLNLSGDISATSQTGKGGNINVTGQHVTLNNAHLNASGATQGGTIHIGGEKHGAGTLQRADTTSIDKNTTIKADATQQGNGGKVVVWSDKHTDYAGNISAQGKGKIGKGGDVEVSGKQTLNYTGFTNLKGLGGFGTLLLDPYNVTISNNADNNNSSFTASGNDSIINVGTLQTALGGANVTVSTSSGGNQDGNITVANALSWTGGSKLTLDAANNIFINADINATGNNSGLILKYGQGATDGIIGGKAADYRILTGASIGLVSTGANGGVFQTQLGSNAANLKTYTIITDLGSEGSTTGTDLQGINGNLGGNYVLGADIDASATSGWSNPHGQGFNPLGRVALRAALPAGSLGFKGRFDGLGHKVSNLKEVTNDGTNAGLFSYANGAYIANIGLDNADISIDNGFIVGALVGTASNNTVIHNTYATGSGETGSKVTATGTGERIGGLVGWLSNSSISNSYTKVTVTDNTDSGTPDTGGLVGMMEGSSTISNSFSTGAVTAVRALSGDRTSAIPAYRTGVGGLVGSMRGGGASIVNTYSTANVSGQNSPTGGLVGSVRSTQNTITNSYAAGHVEANKVVKDNHSIGGLVGGIVIFRYMSMMIMMIMMIMMFKMTLLATTTFGIKILPGRIKVTVRGVRMG